MATPPENSMTLTSTTGREKVTLHIEDAGTLPEVLESVERFLRASGYIFDGHLTIDPEGIQFGNVPYEHTREGLEGIRE